MAIAKRSSDLLLAFGLVLVLSCKYDPHPKSGTQACASGSKLCPNGYVCHAGACWIPADIIPDASGPAPDASQVVDGPGGSGSDTTTATRTGTNTSVACGGLNRACCANNECTAVGTVCNGLTCVACGAAGRPCCANSVCSGTGTICTAAGNCVVCGSSGYICCANNTCLGSDTTCLAGNCVPCGAPGQPCCSGNLCGGTLVCTGGTCQPPAADGGVSTSTGTKTTADAGTTTVTNTATVTRTVRDAGIDAATATSTGTTTATKTTADAGIDASTSTGIIIPPRTILFTAITTFPPISTGGGSGKFTSINTGVMPP